MKVIVIGGGAAGMLAAITASKEGNKVTLIEKTSSLGNKVKITGKGRCNVTFDGDIEDFEKNVVNNFKFLYSSFNNFSNKDLVNYLEELGVKTKVERGGRIFPQSDRAQDIVDAFKKELVKYNVNILYNTDVKEIIQENGIAIEVITSDKKRISFDKCILATGGMSYSKTGSDGYGYKIAEKLGHSIVDIKPGLVPLRSNDNDCKELQGLSLRNVKLKLYDEQNMIYEGFGEMLFSHFGITGPIVLSGSSKLNRIHNLENKFTNGQIYGIIDMKPAIDLETIDNRICREFTNYSNKEFKNSMNELLPKKLIPVVIRRSGIDPDKKVHQINKEERQNLVDTIKNFRIAISGLMPVEIGIVTAGGINVKEVNPKTMESKITKNLYFAGEILDIDALTGGFNLQIAFATAYAAGKNY